MLNEIFTENNLSKYNDIVNKYEKVLFEKSEMRLENTECIIDKTQLLKKVIGDSISDLQTHELKAIDYSRWYVIYMQYDVMDRFEFWKMVFEKYNIECHDNLELSDLIIHILAVIKVMKGKR